MTIYYRFTRLRTPETISFDTSQQAILIIKRILCIKYKNNSFIYSYKIRHPQKDTGPRNLKMYLFKLNSKLIANYSLARRKTAAHFYRRPPGQNKARAIYKLKILYE